jgi:uncharacterized protein (TIGR00255 family)
MFKSMTGYGRCQETVNGRQTLVEIKSVNHRYFEFSARVPRAYGFLEERMKTFLQGRVSRGKVDVNVTVHNIERADSLVEVNISAAAGYINALREANKQLGLVDDVTLSTLIRLPDVFNVCKNPEDEGTVWADVKPVAENALQSFLEMRSAEGSRMTDDISARLSDIEGLVLQIELAAPEITEAYRNRLFAKLSEILANSLPDEQRVLTEAAIFAEKTAVDEEIARLKSHIIQFRSMLDSQEAVGRKLDFLIQEFNREANTIGSKAQSRGITQTVISLKSEIEKIREQIQNVD